MTNSTTQDVTIKPETSSDKTATTQKRIIKINQCPSLSNNSTLTYHIGCDEGDDNKAIFFRVFANSGNGFFNKDWIALSDIQTAFENWPVDSTITSFTLWSLLKGKSSNTSAFLLAALKEEGIVAALKGKRRNHEFIEPTEFLAEMDKLIKSDVNLADEGTDNKKSVVTTKTSPTKRTKKAQSKSA